MVSQGSKKRIAVFDENANAWYEYIASGSTIPLTESGVFSISSTRTLKGPAEKQIGAVVPLYPLPFDDGAFTQVASIIKKHPAQDVFVVVNSDTVTVSSILAPDKKLINWIRFLKANGAKVLGKVNTGFGVSDKILLHALISKWKENYPDIDGIYLGLVGQGTGIAQGYYKPLVNMIKEDIGLQYVVGSLGTQQELINTTPENVEALVRDVDFDILILYEGKGFPEPSLFAQGWMQKYPRSKLGMIITGVDADENVQKMQDFVMQLVGTYKAVGYVYVNSDSGARMDNPYTSISNLFEVQLQTMDMLAQSEGNTKGFWNLSKNPQYVLETVEGKGDIQPSDTSKALSTTTTQDLEKDVNGIRKIYPDAKQNYQEWYFNERDPFKDPQLKDEEDSNLRRMQDGSDSWYIDGGSKGQVRIAGWSKPGTYWEDATELTIYFKQLMDPKLPKGKSRGKYFQIYLRGGDHSTQKGRGGEASCYKARMTTEGRVYLVKEIQHSPPGYTKNLPGKQVSLPKKSTKGQWIGMKLILYNIQEQDGGPVWVKTECWVDSTCTAKNGTLDTSKQKWVKTAEYVDKGGWRCSDMKKPTPWPTVDYNSKTPKVRQPNEIISKPGGTKEGNLGAYRTDYRATCFKHFCIRQIENPSHAD